MNKSEDQEYEEYKIESVEPFRGDGPKMWQATLEHGYMVTLPRGGGAKQPKEGMVVRTYGDIEEGNVRGIDLDGASVFYRTPEQQEQWLRDQEKAAAEAAKADYAIRKHEFAHRLTQIPRVLQLRIDRLREEADDADDFNALYLESEIIVSEHAWWLSQLIYTPIDLGIYKSLPSVSKMSSVYAQMCDDIRDKFKKTKKRDAPGEKQTQDEYEAELLDLRFKCDTVEGTVFLVGISPEWLHKIFEIALTIIGDEDKELYVSTKPRAIQSSEDMLS